MAPLARTHRGTRGSGRAGGHRGSPCRGHDRAALGRRRAPTIHSTMTTSPHADTRLALPLDDPYLERAELDLVGLMAHWAPRSRLRPMTAEAMRGADLRAQRLGTTGDRLM